MVPPKYHRHSNLEESNIRKKEREAQKIPRAEEELEKVWGVEAAVVPVAVGAVGNRYIT